MTALFLDDINGKDQENDKMAEILNENVETDKAYEDDKKADQKKKKL